MKLIMNDWVSADLSREMVRPGSSRYESEHEVLLYFYELFWEETEDVDVNFFWVW